MYKDKLTNVSDHLVESDDEWIDFDKFKDSEKRLKKFKSVDSILFNREESRNEFDVIFFEFKRCDLFYKNHLTVAEEKIVDSIINDVPEKILHSRTILIYEYFIKKYSLEVKNTHIKPAKIKLILGNNNSKDQKSRMRAREAIKENREKLKLLKEAINKFTNTFLFSCLHIITANEFKEKYHIN